MKKIENARHATVLKYPSCNLRNVKKLDRHFHGFWQFGGFAISTEAIGMWRRAITTLWLVHSNHEMDTPTPTNQRLGKPQTQKQPPCVRRLQVGDISPHAAIPFWGRCGCIDFTQYLLRRRLSCQIMEFKRLTQRLRNCGSTLPTK